MKLGTQFNPLPQANVEMAKRDKTLEKIGAAVALGMEDAASRTIADTLQNQISSASQGLMNANDAISMMQIASGALTSLSEQTQNLNDMSIRYNNASLNDSQKQMLNAEFTRTVDAMQQSIDNASYNGKSLFGNPLNFSMGEGSVSASIPELSTGTVNIDDTESIQNYQSTLNQAISDVGSATNQFVSETHTLLAKIVSTTSAKSQIADTDMGDKIREFQQQNLKLDMSQIAIAHQNDLLRQHVTRLLG